MLLILMKKVKSSKLTILQNRRKKRNTNLTQSHKLRQKLNPKKLKSQMMRLVCSQLRMNPYRPGLVWSLILSKKTGHSESIGKSQLYSLPSTMLLWSLYSCSLTLTLTSLIITSWGALTQSWICFSSSISFSCSELLILILQLELRSEMHIKSA